MNRYRAPAALGLIFAALCLTACVEAVPANQVEPSGPMSAEAEPSSDDTDVAQMCGMLSIIQTNLVNADLDHEAGVITSEQYAAIVNASALNYRALTVMPARAGALIPEATAVVTAIERETPTSEGAVFQPFRTDERSSSGYASAAAALRDACESYGFPISIYGGSSTGG